MGNIDALNRLPVDVSEQGFFNTAYVFICEVHEEKSLLTTRFITWATRKDPRLAQIKFCILHGWPGERVNTFEVYIQRQNELSILQDCT